MKHFADTYQQINDRLKPGSLIIFDKGANSNLSKSGINRNTGNKILNKI